MLAFSCAATDAADDNAGVGAVVALAADACDASGVAVDGVGGRMAVAVLDDPLTS